MTERVGMTQTTWVTREPDCPKCSGQYIHVRSPGPYAIITYYQIGRLIKHFDLVDPIEVVVVI